MADKVAVENLQEYYKPLKKDGRLYIVLFLTIMPGLCFMSVKLHVIKLAAKDTLRCEIESLENASWSPQDIKKISEPVAANQKCYIYNYDYHKFASLTLKETEQVIDEEFPNSEKMICPRFIITKNSKLMPQSYAEEFASYCESLRDDIFYEMGAVIPYILSCLFVVPLADIFGRKSVLKIGCQLMLFAVFMKIILLNYIRETIGLAILHVAYPCLKYTTESLDKIRPFGFMVRYIGKYIPPLFVVVLPRPSSIYWKYMQLIKYSVVLVLPLMPWFFPESVAWFASRKENKLAHFVGQTLESPAKHSEVLFRLQNRRRSFQGVKKLLREFLQINTPEIVFINVVAFTVGFSSLCVHTKHKLWYYNLDVAWVTFLNIFGGIVGFFLTLFFIYFMNVGKFVIAGLFLINGVLYSLLAKFQSDFESTIIITFFLDISSTILLILFEFYLHRIFPTSHRCLCTAWCGACQIFGLLMFLCVKEVHLLGSQILASTMCMLGCILTILMVKNFPSTKPPFLNFVDAELELIQKRRKICCLVI
ncbi:uncharacterized protein LOC135128323 isoform X2 [Zophobas morio]|uniref:uncharacterized protein LOC135128323 isoform X2 n=1 Tax=Zophobas morio TaxID=2755281 RepID=UPI003082A266